MMLEMERPEWLPPSSPSEGAPAVWALETLSVGAFLFGKSLIPDRRPFCIFFRMVALFHTLADRSVNVLHCSGKTKRGDKKNVALYR